MRILLFLVMALTLTMFDRNWAGEAYRSGEETVRLGQLAALRAQSPVLKTLGRQLSRDQRRLDESLRRLAGLKFISLDRSDRQANHDLQRLMALEGADFDRGYLKLALRSSREAVLLLQKEIREGSDDNLRAWAGQMLPWVQQHQRLAELAQSQFTSQ